MSITADLFDTDRSVSGDERQMDQKIPRFMK